MDLKSVHIIGIGGCASSAIAEYLYKKGVKVSGSEMKPREDLKYLENIGIKIKYFHNSSNIYLNGKPDIVLFSPAIVALNPDNPEIVEAKNSGIKTESWEEFIGNYFYNAGITGITVSGSEGKGTTAGILTTILQNTEYDPISILGARIKSINSNIYFGEGKTYILEADEYNRNFLSYHPEINIMINFQYEHPETYKNFKEYKDAFYKFFQGMSKSKKQIFHSTKTIIEFVKEYQIENVIWFGYEDEIEYLKSNLEKSYIKDIWCIKNHKLSSEGNFFTIEKLGDSSNVKECYDFEIPSLPGYIALNATGAILGAIELGLDIEIIQKNIKKFNGMVRRFDITKTKAGGVIITDYGHSPESVSHIISEIRNIYKGKKLHIIFQPHLFSRTYNFFEDFCNELSKADKISIIDIYPARENVVEWENKISSKMLVDRISNINPCCKYAGKVEEIEKSLEGEIDPSQVICFLGAGNMDQYYGKIIDKYK